MTQRICYFVGCTRFVFNNKQKVLKEFRPSDMHLMKVLLTIDKLQGFVIRVQDKLSLHKIVFLLLQGSNYNI